MNSKRDENRNFFLKNNRGISDVIITVIMVGLVLAAIAIVWAVVNGLIGQSTERVSFTAKCLNINVAATSVTCVPDKAAPTSCTVLLERTGSGTDIITGVKVVFENASNSRSTITDVSGNIDILGQKSQEITIGLISNLNKVESTVYFNDTSGNQKLCSQSSEFSF